MTAPCEEEEEEAQARALVGAGQHLQVTSSSSWTVAWNLA